MQGWRIYDDEPSPYYPKSIPNNEVPVTKSTPVPIGVTADGAYSFLDDRALVHLFNKHPEYVRVAERTRENVNVDQFTVPTDWDVHYHYLGTGGDLQMVAFVDDCIVYLSTRGHTSSVSARVWAADIDHAIIQAQRIIDLFPKATTDLTADTVRVAFHYMSSHGPERMFREIGTQTWDQIEHNYSQSAHEAMSALMQMKPPFSGGKLILLHGPAGTGKSHIVQALARKWRPWCDANYITDPERFFASTSDLLSLILRQSPTTLGLEDDEELLTMAQQLGVSKRDLLQGAARYHLFIMEDTDEFLTADAKKRTGQAMSRLLNIADGMIGQGLNILFLITTNEDVSNLHKAVTRPGRCLVNSLVPELTKDEANAWMARHGVDGHQATEAQTLATLYDQLREANEQQVKATLQAGGNVSIGQYL